MYYYSSCTLHSYRWIWGLYLWIWLYIDNGVFTQDGKVEALSIPYPVDISDRRITHPVDLSPASSPWTHLITYLSSLQVSTHIHRYNDDYSVYAVIEGMRVVNSECYLLGFNRDSAVDTGAVISSIESILHSRGRDMVL